jgi:phosphoglycerate dehydrogenase-like enzyme
MTDRKINVLLMFPRHGGSDALPEECLRQMADVSRVLNVVDGAGLEEAARKGDAAARKQLDALLAETEVLWGVLTPKELVARAPRLKWVQVPFSGADAYGVPEFDNSNVLLTNSSGMHGTQVGEMAFWHMICLAKNAGRLFRQQNEKRYEPLVPVILEGKTVGVLGLGPIGKHIAKISRGFGMKVIGIEADPGVKCRDCEAIYPAEKMHEALARCDFVVDALPLLEATRHIVGEEEFRRMKPAAFFVNIGRGGTVDQTALIRALRDKVIAGAGLDVQDPEPLPPDSPLWEMPNVTISPHIGGQRPDYLYLATALFAKNLKLYVSGKKLFNVVDKKTLAKPAG